MPVLSVRHYCFMLGYKLSLSLLLSRTLAPTHFPRPPHRASTAWLAIPSSLAQPALGPCLPAIASLSAKVLAPARDLQLRVRQALYTYFVPFLCPPLLTCVLAGRTPCKNCLW